jgi:hypothetical protein
MDSTVVLTGILPAVIIISTVLTALAAIFLLWRYKRAVIRAMNTTMGKENLTADSSVESERSAVDPPPLKISVAGAGPDRGASYNSEEDFRGAGRRVRRAGFIYTVGGVAYALVFTTAWMVAAGDGFLVVRCIWLFACFSWPIVPALGLVAVVRPSRYWGMVGGYFIAMIVIALVALARNPDLTVGQMLFFWFYTNGPGTLMLLAFMRPRIRAVGPMVLAFLVMGVTGAMAVIQVVAYSDRLLKGVVAIGSMLGMGATALFVVLHLIGFGLFGFIGWRLLGWVGRRYQLKQTNDQSLTLDAMWLMFGVVQSITLVFEAWGWIFTGVVAFAVYKMAVSVGFAKGYRYPLKTEAPPDLLLLRVFALGRRSEALFRMLSKLWLRTGNIRMIAGPDLATTTVEPHEFLEFLARRLRQRFIQDRAGLDDRMAAMDPSPDRYGLHRVETFICHADTWQMTMEQLSKNTGAVLMDLRNFSPSNQGCLYELRILLNNVHLSQVLLIVDHTTDRDFLRQTLYRLWGQLAGQSKNARLSAPEVRMFQLSNQWKTQLTSLLSLLQTMSK